MTFILTRFLEPWKASLASRYWLAQERSRLKAQIYPKLLEYLDGQARILDHWHDDGWRQDLVEQEAPEAGTKGRSVEELKLVSQPLAKPDPLARRLGRLSEEVQRLRSVADLRLAKEVRDALDKMEKEIDKAYTEGANYHHCRASEAVQDARRVVAQAAERDLVLRIED